MSALEVTNDEADVNEGLVRTFCEGKQCRGVLVEAQDIDECEECSICLNYMIESAISVNLPCKHTFCAPCLKSWKIKRGNCPFCRSSIEREWTFNRSRKPLDFNILKSTDHLFCDGSITCLYARKYLSALQGDWLFLASFMIRSQIDRKLYINIKGTDHLDLSEYEQKGNLLDKGKSHATLKTKEGKIQVVYCCYFRFLSMRLVIMANEDDIPVAASNEYADKAVGYLTTQLAACWSTLPPLINRNQFHHLFIRKFESHTASLLLGGHEDIGPVTLKIHKRPVENELRNMIKCNFDNDYFEEQWSKFPPLDFSKGPGYSGRGDICFCNYFGSYYPYDDDDESQSDQEAE